jgi:hypothetical protein
MTMPLDAAVVSLRRHLHALQEAVSALRVTVVEDRPVRGSVVLVDHLDNLTTDVISALEEADAHVAEAQLVDERAGTFDVVSRALRLVHGLLNRVTATYVGELAAHDRIAQLLAMGGERGREWRVWSREVKTGIDRCGAPLHQASGAILECWSELAERMTRTSVSVQATNIGQQITVRDEQLELAAKAK